MVDTGSDHGPAIAAVRTAVHQFNQGEFWECHETLEEFWGEEHGPLREFYHGLIQLAAGFVHVQRHNWYGAVRLIGDGIETLAPFRPACMEVQLDSLLTEAADWRRALAVSGVHGLGALSRRAPPQIRLTGPT